MKYLYFLLFVAVVQGFSVEKYRLKRSGKIPPPTLQKLTAIDPAGFEVEWTPVSSGDPKDPITGYKVKIWEITGKKVIRYKIVDGVKVLVEEEGDIPQMDNDKLPTGIPQVIDTDKTKVVVNSIKLDTLYEVRVQAHTKRAEGPLSVPMRIKLHSNDHSKDVYKVD